MTIRFGSQGVSCIAKKGRMSYFSLHESTESKSDNNLKSHTQTFPWLSGCKVPAFQSQLNDRTWVRDQPTCPTAVHLHQTSTKQLGKDDKKCQNNQEMSKCFHTYAIDML